ncbi:hypothetical protein [Rhizobium sp. F40D2]|uniref:hypothetical protein n=1 Tax=Rhizobium sp. F40D2 TaxID=3453141 RepID=UPI003F24BA5B
MKNVRPYASRLFAAVLAASAAIPAAASAENSAAVGGHTFANKGLVGIGRIPANQRDKFGETFGSGSGMAIDSADWSRDGAGYKGTLYLLPDRGYNAVGTVDYRPRLNTIAIGLTPTAPGATPEAGKDGGDSGSTRQNTRAMIYDAADSDHLKLVHEYVVPLPVFKDAKDKTVVAAESEIVALSDKSFLMLARDSGNGQGLKGDTSLYRKINIVDLSGATDIAGSDFDADKPIAPKGVVDPSLTPATLTPFIDINDKAELARFGLHNGAPNDKNNLSEKWEAIGLASVLDPNLPDDYFLFVANDNDFLTQDGFQVGAAYKADGGADVDTMFQVFQVTLPGLRK